MRARTKYLLIGYEPFILERDEKVNILNDKEIKQQSYITNHAAFGSYINHYFETSQELTQELIEEQLERAKASVIINLIKLDTKEEEKR